MISVINKRCYNTETATIIASHSWGECGDLDFREETLYKTPKGGYFLVVEASIWAAAKCNGGARDYIQAFTTTEALEWCEVYGYGDEASTEFRNLIVDA